MGRHLSEKGLRVEKLLRSGLMPREIKAQLSVSSTLICWTRNRIGMPPFKPGRIAGLEESSIQLQEAARNGIANGMSMAAIARQQGVSRQRLDQLMSRCSAQARNKTKQLLKSGIISKPEKCDGCGRATELEMHHPNYLDAPDKIKWLCLTCHSEHHPNRSLPIYVIIELLRRVSPNLSMIEAEKIVRSEMVKRKRVLK